jgi:hypothetical protein
MVTDKNICIKQNIQNLGLGKYYLKFQWYANKNDLDYSRSKIQVYFNNTSLGILTSNRMTMY